MAKPHLYDFFFPHILKFAKMNHDLQLLKDAKRYFGKQLFDKNGEPVRLFEKPAVAYRKMNPLARDLEESIHSSGLFDLYVSPSFNKILKPDEKAIIPTGLAIRIPPGRIARVICDPLWRDELVFVDEMFITHNHLALLHVAVVNYSNEPFEVRPYMRFAQLILLLCDEVADLVEYI